MKEVLRNIEGFLTVSAVIVLQRGGFYKWKNHDPGISYVKKASDFLNVPIDEIVK